MTKCPTHHLIILDVVARVGAGCLRVGGAEAQPDVVLGGEPLVLGAAHQQLHQPPLAHGHCTVYCTVLCCTVLSVPRPGDN